MHRLWQARRQLLDIRLIKRTGSRAWPLPQGWADKTAKLRQKDRDARWMLVFGKSRLRPDGTKHADVAIPVFGCKSHAGIDRRHG